MIRRLGRFLAALALTAATTVAGVTVTAGAAQADGCYTWGRTLSQGRPARTSGNSRSGSPATPATARCSPSTARTAPPPDRR
ncbi:hypothetical protein NKG94_18930 [Micromonospora sp. M12]